MGSRRATGSPKIEEVPITRLKPAEWNYKKPSTPDQVQRLAASIKRDKSAGVLAVREVGKGLEVMDGNHRLEAIRELGWPTVRVENFGKITKADAVLIAQRRNHQWFEDDTIALSRLFKDEVLTSYDLDALAEFMPLERAALERLAELCDFDWNSMPDPPAGSGDHLSVPLTPELKALWAEWMPIATNHIGSETSKLDAFQLAVETAIKVHRRATDVPSE